MSKTLEAKRMLDEIPPYPWKFDSVPSNMPNALVGAIRSADGRNVIQPHQESASMIVGYAETINFIISAPKMISDLVAEIEALRAKKEA